MIPLLADEDFNGKILRGLHRLVPELDLISVRNVGLAEQPDQVVVDWAAANCRVLLTHDVNTMLAAAAERVRTGRVMPGVIAVPQLLGIGAAVSDLLVIVTCADPGDLEGQIWYLPL